MADPYVGAARAAIGQGLGLGWGDEGEAWLRSKLGEGEYDQLVKQIRNEYAQYGKENPLVSGALEFAGGAAPSVAAMFLPGMQPAAATSTLKALAKMAAMGAGTGAVAGAGTSDEANRVSGGLGGAALGAVVGGAAPVAMRGVSKARQWLMERANPSPARVGGIAAQKMNEALRQEQLTPQQIERVLAQDRSMGVPSVVANVNPGLADLAEAVAQRTGSGARTIEKGLNEQKLGARERAYQQTAKALKPGDYYADEQKLIEEMRKRAGSAYETAYARGEINDPAIMEVLKLPQFQGFFDRARKIADIEATSAKLRGEDPSKYELRDIYKMVTGPDGTVAVESVQLPDVRTLDYIKRGIDATIDAGFSGQGMSKAEAAALKDLKRQFVEAIDRNAPEYAAARQAYAGDMEVLDAMRLGIKDFNKMDHEQVTKLVAGMGPSEREAFRTGVSRELYSKVMDPSGNFNAAQRIIGSPEMQAKLQPLFDNPAHFDLYRAAMEREAQLFHQANKVLGGSQTGKRQQMREALEDESPVGGALAGAVTGGFWGSLTGLVGNALRSGSMTEPVADRLAKMLMSKDPAEVAAVVQLLEQQAAGAQKKALRAGAAEAGVTGGAATAIWPDPLEERPAEPVE